MAVAKCQFQFVEDAATVEAMALRDGLALAESVGCNRIVVNSDCMEVIEVMKRGGNSLGLAVAIFEDCFFTCLNFESACVSIVLDSLIGQHILLLVGPLVL